MKKFYIINDWDDKTMTRMGEWVNDGREAFDSYEEAAKWIAGNPDESRLSVVGIEIDEE